MYRLVGSAFLAGAVLILLNTYAGPGAPARPKAAADALATSSATAGASADLLSSLSVDDCGRLFIDGGANLGESVDAFAAGNFLQCALTGPARIYAKDWSSLTGQQRRERMAPLGEPRSFCIRSFEAAPALLGVLRERETRLRGQGLDVRFVDGALSNVSASQVAHQVVRYSQHPQGETAASFAFADLMPGVTADRPLPRQLSSRVVMGPAFGVVELLERVRRRNASAVVALRLDVEGAEYAIMRSLVERTDLLCFLSYLFVEFHYTAVPEQRAGLPRYGITSDAFEALKEQVHAAIERPGCRLRLYWRSFWASCGDKQRFEWRDTPQATQGAEQGLASTRT